MKIDRLSRLPFPSRRAFLQSASAAALAATVLSPKLGYAEPAHADARDRERMRALAAWTAKTFDTPDPVPFGAVIFHSQGNEMLMRGANAVGPEHDPSAHAELRTIRLGCQKLAAWSLRGYTLYTTCEPCPMCMSCALWAGLDRVVYGATIADAAHFGHQILIPAAEVAKRYDLPCEVDGPVERDACYALFTDPRMQKQFARWKSMS